MRYWLKNNGTANQPVTDTAHQTTVLEPGQSGSFDLADDAAEWFMARQQIQIRPDDGNGPPARFWFAVATSMAGDGFRLLDVPDGSYVSMMASQDRPTSAEGFGEFRSVNVPADGILSGDMDDGDLGVQIDIDDGEDDDVVDDDDDAPKPLQSITVADLKDIAEKEGVDLTGITLKDDIIAAIEKARAAE